MQCSKINTHSRKFMILLECLTDHLISRVLLDSLTPAYATYENLIFLFVDNPPIYISIGPTPTIDIMCGLPSDVYQLGRLRRLIFYLDYPPIFIIFRQPSEPFSQELPHALTPIVLGCPSAYEMHDVNFISIL